MNKDKLKKSSEEFGILFKQNLDHISGKIGQYFIMVGIIYFIYFLYKFYPNLVSFENATIVFLAYFFIFLFYKKKFLKSYIHSYLEGLNDIFEMISGILTFLIFFGIFILYMGGQDIGSLDGLIIIFYVSIIFGFIYNKNKKIDLLEKKDYKANWFLINLIINTFLFLYLKKWLLLNDIKEIYVFIFPILAIYNILSFILFNLFLQKSNLETKAKSKEKLGISKLFSKIIPYILLIFMFLLLDKYNNKIIENKKQEEEIIKKQIEVFEEERKIIKIATGSNFPGIPQKIDYSILYENIKIGDYYNFERNIYLGDSGKDVEKIQEILKLEGFYTGSISGIFDSETSQSLQKFFNSKTKQDYSNLGIDGLTLWKLIEIKVRKNPTKIKKTTTNLN